MVESSVKTISRPVINRLPVDVNQLDEFACRQLDRVCMSFGHDAWNLAHVILESSFHSSVTIANNPLP